MATMPPNAPKPPLLLGLLIVAMTGTIGLAIFRSERQTPDQPEPEPETGRPPFRRRVPRIPTGKWTLLKTTNQSVSEMDIPKIGMVRMQRPPYGLGLEVWVKLPPNVSSSLVQATLQIGSLPLARVPVVGTTVANIVCVMIPQYYPPGHDRGSLTLWDGNVNLSSQVIKGLLPTKRAWPASTPVTGPVTCGPAKLSARVWQAIPASEAGNVDADMTISMPPRPGQHWELTRLPLIPSAFTPANLPSFQFSKIFGHWPSRIEDGERTYSWATQVPLAPLQGETLMEGRVQRVEKADEFVEFHNVPIKASQVGMPANVNRLCVDPAKPITATSPGGVKVTLYPFLGDNHQNIASSTKIVVMSYSTDPGENNPGPLPKSPIAKGRSVPISIRLYAQRLDESGSARFLGQLSNFSKTGVGSQRFLIGDGRGYEEGVMPTLRLVVRHRWVAESYPYSFVVPILPGPPADTRRTTSPFPEPE